MTQIRPGQSTLAFFTAENTSNKVITGVSTYNVTPQQAGTYFNKIQCFCFEVGPKCLPAIAHTMVSAELLTLLGHPLQVGLPHDFLASLGML